MAHSGNGRRDQLSAGERTRILRMLRDEGGRMADEDSQVYIGAAPPGPNDQFDFDDSPAPAPVAARKGPPSSLSPSPRDIPAKPAVVVGLAQAKARSKRSSERPAVRGPARRSVPPPDASASASISGRRSPLPPPFTEEPTRQVDGDMLAQLRGPQVPAGAPLASSGNVFDEATRMANAVAPATLDNLELDESTRPGDQAGSSRAPLHLSPSAFEDNMHEEATRMASLDGLAALERASRASQPPAPPPPVAPAPAPSRSNNRLAQARPPLANGNEERTRAVDIRNDRSISDIDWDID